MSSLAERAMTRDEAVETDRLIKRHINTTRYLLLDMRDRKGWKAMGYESFVEYGEKELGFASTHLYRLADSAEISLQIGFSPIGEKSPPETHLRPLKAVPEEERKSIWEEATRKAQEDGAKLTAQRVDDAAKEWKQRQEETQAESNERRKKIRELEEQIDLLGNQVKPEPEKVEVPPADYESIKKKAGELQAQTEALQKQLDSLKNQQAKLVKDQVAAKLHERQTELDKLEADKQAIEEVVARKKAYLDSLDSEVKRIETHRSVIDGCRLELIGLAAFLNDLDSINDQDTVKRWLALADMLADASQSIRMVFEPSRTDLRIAA